MRAFVVGNRIYAFEFPKEEYEFELEDLSRIDPAFVEGEAFRFVARSKGEVEEEDDVEEDVGEVEAVFFLTGEEYLAVQESLRDPNLDVVYVRTAGLLFCERCKTIDLAIDGYEGGGKEVIDGQVKILCSDCRQQVLE